MASTPSSSEFDAETGGLGRLILQAASEGNASTLEYMLPALPTRQVPLIHTAMCKAAYHNHFHAFRTIAQYCDNIHADDPRRATNAVICAMLSGHCKILDFILGHGGDIDRSTRSGRNALATAVSLGRRDLVHVIISRGANVNRPTTDDRTALCLATTMCRLDLVKTLVNNGAAINQRCHCRAPESFETFHNVVDVAALKGQTDIATFLLSCGAGFYPESDLFLSALQYVLANGGESVARKLIAMIPDDDTRLRRREISALCNAIQKGDLRLANHMVHTLQQQKK